MSELRDTTGAGADHDRQAAALESERPGEADAGDGLGPVILRARDVHKEYPGVRDPLHILKGIDLEVRSGEVIAILGASGSGKSTLLHILGTLDRPTRGTVLFDGEDLFQMGERGLARFRNRNLGFVFQFHHLLPEFTALENVCMPGRIAKMDPTKAAQRGRALLEEVGLADRADHKPSELSGGEQQRVALARSLFPRPRLVLADEPSGNLDPAAARRLHQLMYTVARTHRQAWVVVTHNEELAKLADTRCRIEDGALRHVDPSR
ncbi:MAG: ABC transporter ATP-binding protein [Candidatus Eisenbacteria bacterium]|uniref:ABC transporter ATP-binding protein n=1 Tax=Eiseniibacteriota bacterium TaxID=2212470 RepID=A0A956M0B0_UNCEI|nr:ABC transporter ATP-binding protein [Candidatus Eisenbacteria bacterium]